MNPSAVSHPTLASRALASVASVGLCLLAATAPATPPPAAGTTAPTTPAAPAVATAPAAELRFNDFFQMPIGPRGLEFSDKLRGLNGQQVRITGRMVNHLHADPRVFILSPVALKFHQCEYGLCDDLPATAVHVHVPGNPRDRVAFSPGEITLTGRLSVGNVEELDGRVSTVRLFLDPTQATALRTIAAASGAVR